MLFKKQDLILRDGKGETADMGVKKAFLPWFDP